MGLSLITAGIGWFLGGAIYSIVWGKEFHWTINVTGAVILIALGHLTM